MKVKYCMIFLALAPLPLMAQQATEQQMQQMGTSIEAVWEASEGSVQFSPNPQDDTKNVSSLMDRGIALKKAAMPPAAQVEKLIKEADALTKRLHQEIPAFALTAPYIQAENEHLKRLATLADMLSADDGTLPDHQALRGEILKLESLSPDTVAGVESITQQENDLIAHIQQEEPGKTADAGTVAPTSSPGGQPITTVKGHRHTTTYFSPDCPVKILKVSLGDAQLAGADLYDVQGVPHYTSEGFIGTLYTKEQDISSKGIDTVSFRKEYYNDLLTGSPAMELTNEGSHFKPGQIHSGKADLTTPTYAMARGVKVWVYGVLFDDGKTWADPNADIDGNGASCFYEFQVY